MKFFKRCSAALVPLAAALALAGPAHAYVHMDACKAALTGANGDNDWARYYATFSPPPINAGFNGYDIRYNNNQVAAQVQWLSGNNWSWFFGYCMGPDDAHIVDNMPNPPSGW